jgi:hypothetical protein
VFPTHAVICTMVGGAAALEVMVNVVSSCPAGTTTLGGTCATSGWSLKSSTVVGAGSGKASETVPVADAPLFTWLGATVRKLMVPSARESRRDEQRRDDTDRDDDGEDCRNCSFAHAGTPSESGFPVLRANAAIGSAPSDGRSSELPE